MKILRSSLIVSAFCAGACAPQLGYGQDTGTETSSDHSFSANIGLLSDYRFRGISQTYNRPAVQGGFDYSHRSGFYAGTWASNVSGNLYVNGAGLEWDVYGGYKFAPLPELNIDVGIYAYLYPGAHYNDAASTDYDNTELFIGASYGWLSAKYWYAVTDYFGVNEDTYGNYAPVVNNRGGTDTARALPADRGDSRGSGYLELNASFSVADNTTLGLHAGHLDVENYGELSYTDYKISLAHAFDWATVTAAAVTSNAGVKWYRYCETNAAHCRNPAGSALVLSLSRAL